MRAEILVGSTFAGGIAQYRVGGQLRATSVLELGAKDLRMSELDQAGVLIQGLNWHGISPLQIGSQQIHRVIDIQTAGNLISIQQRD